ncbi:hypothetical protein ACTNDZ_10955 [Selenomonas montiformis]|uniref:hypothetical protein n=1 Tax=Selenomonas montiformis TaxID=2652285 RepID=UPI003F8B4C37
MKNMVDIISLDDYEDKRTGKQKEKYNDHASKHEMVVKLKAREELMVKRGIIHYDSKIRFVTSELRDRKEANESFKMIWVAFTQAGDFIMNYGDIRDLKGIFLAYVDLLEKYFTEDFISPQRDKAFEKIKVRTFDLLATWNQAMDDVEGEVD